MTGASFRMLRVRWSNLMTTSGISLIMKDLDISTDSSHGFAEFLCFIFPGARVRYTSNLLKRVNRSRAEGASKLVLARLPPLSLLASRASLSVLRGFVWREFRCSSSKTSTKRPKLDQSPPSLCIDEIAIHKVFLVNKRTFKRELAT